MVYEPGVYPHMMYNDIMYNDMYGIGLVTGV